MSRLKIPILICLMALLTSLLLARVHPFGDAGLYTPPVQSTLSRHSSIPPQVRDTLIVKCADCHSSGNRHTPPFYARLAPFSWLMERDILLAREELDLSAWDTYTPDRQEVMQAKIAQQIRTGRMPLLQYRLLHWNAAITSSEQQNIAVWAHQASAVPESPAASRQPGALQGKLVFEKRCTGCHSLEKNREGPILRGVFGRTSGNAPNFSYSPALKNAHIVWNELTLDQWLTDPDAFLPGNNMDFHVAKPEERQALIRFLKATATPGGL